MSCRNRDSARQSSSSHAARADTKRSISSAGVCAVFSRRVQMIPRSASGRRATSLHGLRTCWPAHSAGCCATGSAGSWPGGLALPLDRLPGTGPSFALFDSLRMPSKSATGPPKTPPGGPPRTSAMPAPRAPMLDSAGDGGDSGRARATDSAATAGAAEGARDAELVESVSSLSCSFLYSARSVLPAARVAAVPACCSAAAAGSRVHPKAPVSTRPVAAAVAWLSSYEVRALSRTPCSRVRLRRMPRCW